jgi:RNA polymerase sigma factor (sigma-70 family)
MSISTLAVTAAPDMTGAPSRESAHARVERVFDRCGVGLYRFFLSRVGRDNVADDLMQHLWLQACKAPAAIPEGELEFWLRRVARNILNDHWRRTSRRPPVVSLGTGVANEFIKAVDAGALPDEVLQRDEMRSHVFLAVTDLPTAEQDLVRWHYSEGQGFEEIGATLGISARAVEGRMYRTRQRLRQALAHLEDND